MEPLNDLTMADSNSFLSSLEILLIAQENEPIGQENKYKGMFKKLFLFDHENVFCVYLL